MLSTPTARIKNGITSAIISVDFTPTKEKNPADELTDKSTITIPDNPNENLVFKMLNVPPKDNDA